jgi:hypothetical protein
LFLGPAAHADVWANNCFKNQVAKFRIEVNGTDLAGIVLKRAEYVVNISEKPQSSVVLKRTDSRWYNIFAAFKYSTQNERAVRDAVSDFITSIDSTAARALTTRSEENIRIICINGSY